jgi:hypothetical protein
MIDEFDNAQEENLFPTLIDEGNDNSVFCQECGDEDSLCRYCQNDEEEDYLDEQFGEDEGHLQDYADCARFEGADAY